jgi:glycosyltransferase involved in cell wall biosynthesis
MRILIVTQMWPSPAAPDLGSFLVPHVAALRSQGHDVAVAAISRRGGSPLKYLRLVVRALRAARAHRPDVVLAHMLFPAGAAGLAAAHAAGVPLVVMAHGQDVANTARPALRIATRIVVRRAAATIANSRWLATRLERAMGGDLHCDVIDLGVDLAAFEARANGAAPPAWPGNHPRLLCVGSLIERKNVVALADAFERLGRGSLVFVGDGPLRPALEGRPGITVVGRVSHAAIPGWMAAADVICQPSRREAFGLATLEGLATGRPVLATMEGGPPEFVTPDVGVLVDPRDPEAILRGLEAVVALPSPNPLARLAAAEHEVGRQARRTTAVLQRAADTR